MTCDNCGADTTNGLALCQACRAWFLVNCEFIPVYFRNLARWRPSQATGARRVRQVAPPMPSLPGSSGRDHIGNVLEEAHGDLIRLTEDLSGARPQLARTIARISRMEEETFVRLACALLVKYVDSLTTLSWISGIVTGVSEIETTLREKTELAVPGWYAGACRLCKIPTHVVPGLTWVTCQGCGATTHASEHLEVILSEARGWVARPKAIAGTLVALLDAEHSVERLYGRIRKWESLGWLVAIRRLDSDGDETGAKLYRLGEVLDLITGGADARAERMTAV